MERLRTALGETYAYHRATEAMMTRVLADARDHVVMAPYHAHWRRAADVLVAPPRTASGPRSPEAAFSGLAMHGAAGRAGTFPR